MWTLCVVTVLAVGVAASFAETVLTDFKSLPAGSVPRKGWETRGGEPDGIYQVEAEGESHFLRAVDSGRSVQLFREVDWRIRGEPILKWQWRVREFPDGSDERAGETNDSAAGVYVVFPRVWFVPQVIKYIWSRVVPKDTVIRRSKWFSMIVVESGETPLDTWVEASRNVAQDFETIFGRRSPDPVAIGFLTDANAVKKTASADYGELRSEPAPAPLTPTPAQ